MSSLSSLEHTAIGALAGVIEVSFMQPTVTIKNALQEGRALPKTPISLYRGYLVSPCQLLHVLRVNMLGNLCPVVMVVSTLHNRQGQVRKRLLCWQFMVLCCRSMLAA